MDATTIRVDRTSRTGSVVDVAKTVLACDTDEAETACIKIGALPDEEQRRINGSGDLTAVAEVDMLIELVWLLPAEIPDDVRRQMSHTVCELLKGDPKLVIETEKRHVAMREKCLRAGAQHDDMPAGFRHLSEEDREAFARQMVELSMKSRDQELQKGYQDLRRNDYELQEKGMSLKRKRMDEIVYCYRMCEEIGVEIDTDAKVHVLDSVKMLTQQNFGVDGEIV